MTGIQGAFDARQFQPQQGTPAHPPGMFDAQISGTEIKPTSSGSGGMFAVEFTTPAGRITRNYNLWNQSAQAVEIANKELSALCHATGVYNLDWTNEGAALRNARCRIEVAPQTKNPEYMEIKRVFDMQGNEPGRPAQQQQAGGGAWGGQGGGMPNAAPQGINAPQAAPLQQGANGGWQQPQQQPPQQGQPPQQQPAWGGQQQQPPQQPPQQNAAPGWQQNQPQGGNGAPNSPPWGGGQR